MLIYLCAVPKILQTFDEDSLYMKPPSPESDAAWNQLMPGIPPPHRIDDAAADDFVLS